MEGFDVLGEIVALLEERALDGAGPLDGATAWLDRVKPLTADHFVRWFPPSFRNAMALVEGVRARHGLELDRGPRAAPSFTRIARDVVACDPEPDTKVPQILGERAARERARREHELAFRRVDARALMEVHREAAFLGEVTRGRFNAAYRRLHPAFDRAEQRRRALVLTHRGRRIEATVRGPHGAEFSISRSAGTDERAVIAALVCRIEMAIGRSAGQHKARAVDRTPKDTKDAHEPNVDADALAQEPGAHAATTTGLDEPETIAAVMRELEQLTARLFGEPKHEATDATPGPENQVDAVVDEDGHLAGDPVDAKERTIEDGSAGPEPEGEAVEQEDVALVAGPAVGMGVHAPTEHPPPVLDATEAHPAVLELAERRARRPPPDTPAPLPTRASSEAPPSAAKGRAPTTAEDQAPPRGTNRRRPPPTRRAAMVRRAAPWRDRRAFQRGLGIYQTQAPPRTRQHGDGQARQGRSRSSPRGYARVGPRNRGPPPRSR